MFRTLRISLGLVSILLSNIFLALLIGILPDSNAAQLEGRKNLCEAIAIHCSVAVQRQDVPLVEVTTRAIAERNPDIVSVGLRNGDGKLLFEIGPHEQNWQPEAKSTGSQVVVPLAKGDSLWGTVELRFKSAELSGFEGFWNNPVLRMIVVLGSMCVVGFTLYLRFILPRLGSGSQSEASVRRVRDALNTLTEGVLILDKNQRIAMANDAFARLVEEAPTDLEGRPVADFNWKSSSTNSQNDKDLPWLKAVAERETCIGNVMGLERDGQRKTLSINTTPIVGEDGAARGALATFDDLTNIERKNAHLRKMLQKLKVSRTEVVRQNAELRDLATRDPLTGCFNRRSFFQDFENHWSSSQRYDQPLSIIMVDVDHFKSINDRFGHSTGDEVLKGVAHLLQTMVRKSDILCRYGGEEFCILLPHIGLADAHQAADRFRLGLAQEPISGVPVTASLGVSSLSLGAKEPRELLDQADRALYHAKRSGRNRAICFDDVPEDSKTEIKDASGKAPAKDTPIPIPFHAVQALVNALAHRHLATAEHSRRVADLCVALAHRRMSPSDCYTLEVAALLHDIGKLGIPDAVLLKPGPLNDEEWKLIRSQEKIGEEIVKVSLSSPDLVSIIRYHHCHFAGDPNDPKVPKGRDLPLGARILCLCDAYDAMTSDRVYRRGLSQEEAITELRKNAAKQFDPELVDAFIERITSMDTSRTRSELNLAKEEALAIGLEIEKVSTALEAKDAQALAMQASRLSTTATYLGNPKVADIAAQLEQSAMKNTSWNDLMQMTIQLMELCENIYSTLPARKKKPGSAPLRTPV